MTAGVLGAGATFDFGSQQSEGPIAIFKTTGLRVPSDEALDYWVKRFDKYNVTHSGIYEQFGRKVIDFQDFDEQLYQLVSDEADTGVAPGIPWQKGPVRMSTASAVWDRFSSASLIHFYRQSWRLSLVSVMLIQSAKHISSKWARAETAAHDRGAQRYAGSGATGFGSVHHMAFRVKDRKELEEWIAHMGSYRFPISGYVDRFYFESLYANIAQGILLEFATDGPGFIDDEEPYETLGERLALPPKFRNNREEIEGLVRQFDTVRSTDFRKRIFGLRTKSRSRLESTRQLLLFLRFKRIVLPSAPDRRSGSPLAGHPSGRVCGSSIHRRRLHLRSR